MTNPASGRTKRDKPKYKPAHLRFTTEDRKFIKELQAALGYVPILHAVRYALRKSVKLIRLQLGGYDLYATKAGEDPVRIDDAQVGI